MIQEDVHGYLPLFQDILATKGGAPGYALPMTGLSTRGIATRRPR